MANSNRTLVPGAKEALNKMKYETATELGINFKNGYNGDIKARDAGLVGGTMVKKLINMAESNLSR
jgi:hypothetical protein